MSIFTILCDDFLWTLSFIDLLHIYLNGKHRHNRYLSKKKKKKKKVEDIMIPFSNEKDDNRSIMC